MSKLDKLNARIDAWYDRQSFETLVLVGLSPLILIGVVVTVISFVFGGK